MSAAALSDAHRRMLEDESGIAPAVISARGYRTATDANELYGLAFSPAQSKLVPGLLIPIHAPDGSNGLYRLRPDHPRQVTRKGLVETLKYEQPKGKGLRLDCNPLARPLLADPSKPIAFVEGEKKADALLSRGLATIALPGVSGFKGRNRLGGVIVSTDFDYIALKGRQVYIIFDSDAATNPQVSQMEARLAEHLKRRGAKVSIVRILPGPDDKRQGADDYLAAGHTIDELLQLVVANPATLHASYANAKAGGLPGIKTNDRHLREVASDALRALLVANHPPYLFVRGGLMARLTLDEHQRPRIEAVTQDALRGRLARVANFYSERMQNDLVLVQPQDPPLDVVRDLLAAGEWPFPALEGIIECPSLRPDGSVITDPGYDIATGVYYQPAAGLAVPCIPDQPTTADVQAAIDLLYSTWGEFPYVDDASQANALGAIITPIIRPAISGPTPLGIIDAPQAGTGKSLLAENIAQVATGRSAAVVTAPRDDDEWRKRITSTLLSGVPIITIDNLTGTLYSGTLAAALTSLTWSDRLLGINEMVHLPQRATWLATGNNIRLGGDIPRRCYWIRLDAKSSRPWMRNGFKHANLSAWVLEHRGQLITAVLTLARAWFAAGQPAGASVSLGTFSEWARIVGGILGIAGVPGFLGNLVSMYETADADGPQWEAFLAALYEQFGDEPATVAQMCAAIGAGGELLEAVPEMLESPIDDKGAIKSTFKIRLGKALSQRRGTRYGSDTNREYFIEDGGEGRKREKKWRIFCRGSEGAEVISTPSDFEGDGNAQEELNTAQGETPSATSATSAHYDLLGGEF